MRNLGLLFWKEYYEGIPPQALLADDPRQADELFAKKNDLFENALVDQTASTAAYDPFFYPHAFPLRVAYPGLLMGTGYSHESGISKDEIRLGFSFDYTTGLPYIPGSTVKGALRSVFKDPDRRDYLRQEVQMTDAQMDAFDAEVFVGTGMPPSRRDVFFDALLDIEGCMGMHPVGMDFITPHKDAITSPTPLRMLRVPPGTIFRFGFQLHDCRDERIAEVWTVARKLDLFQRILRDLGIGAKTHVGYGILECLPGDAKEDKG